MPIGGLHNNRKTVKVIRNGSILEIKLEPFSGSRFFRTNFLTKADLNHHTKLLIAENEILHSLLDPDVKKALLTHSVLRSDHNRATLKIFNENLNDVIKNFKARTKLGTVGVIFGGTFHKVKRALKGMEY